MKKRNHLLVPGLFAAMALTASIAGVRAETKITVGVGHMCCGKCQAATKEALAKVASDVSIDGNDVTMTLKGDDVFLALHALSRGGFPANHFIVGTAPVTIGVAHLCCGKCNAGLKSALTEANLDALDADSMKIADGTLTVRAKDGMKLDLMPVLAAMEKGGFSPTKITVGAAAASATKHIIKTAAR